MHGIDCIQLAESSYLIFLDYAYFDLSSEQCEESQKIISNITQIPREEGQLFRQFKSKNEASVLALAREIQGAILFLNKNAFQRSLEAEKRGEILFKTPHLFPQHSNDSNWSNYTSTSHYPFIGREQELAEIENTLYPANSELHSPLHTTFFLSGSVGTGKTSLVAEYLQRENNKNTSPENSAGGRFALKVWLRGKREYLLEDLHQLSFWLGLGYMTDIPPRSFVPAIYERLRKLSIIQGGKFLPRVLLILDGAKTHDGIITVL